MSLSHIRMLMALGYGLVSVVLVLLVGNFLHGQSHTAMQHLADQNLAALDVAYRATIETYRLDVETRYRTQLNRPEVLDLMAEALQTPEAEMPALRGRLYRLLSGVYDELQQIGLRQFQFHLADDRALLRFHLPERAGDPLFQLRPTLRVANTEHRPVIGLEVGRTLPGFRYVFPLAKAEQHLGSVELSLPFERIHDNLMRLLKTGDYVLLLRNQAIQERVDPEHREKYVEAQRHADFLVENPTISRVTRAYVQSETVTRLNPILREDLQVQRRMAAGETFTLPLLHEGKGYVAAFLSVADIAGQPVAYVASYLEVPALVALHHGQQRNQFLAMGLLSMILLAVWLLLRSRENLQTEVAEHRVTEVALRAAKTEAEHSNAAKSEFLSNMSHEIRTPMNAIIGLSDLSLGLPGISPKLRDYQTKIHTSSKALLAIINDILDYSKIEAGRLELESAAFRIEVLLQNVGDLFSLRADQKGLELLIDLSPGVPPVLIGDALRLGQVMNNLVGNAVKFTESGEVHAKVALLDQQGSLVTLQFSVRDTGIGMTQEQIDHLFQPFTQADGTITRRYGGSGLGLVISKRLVEHMGGDLVVDSLPGKGSCFGFTLTLPMAHSAHIERSPADLRGMRVLVVDDVDTSRLVICEMLHSWGFNVTEAANGYQAIELINLAAIQPERAFEMILTDWKMPEMDGLTLALRIGDQVTNQVLRKMPVILMVTAFGKDQLLAAARGVALDGVLTKPVTPSGLFDAIMQIQGGQQYEDAPQKRRDFFEQAAPIRGANVLLVEDNDINQTVAQDLLERMGLQVIIAGDGEQALAMLDHEVFDVVLMDLQMPVMDGFEAARRIRAQTRFATLPVIAMTAAALVRDREACLAVGMNDHVAKPIVPQDLLNVLLKWVKLNHPQQAHKTTLATHCTRSFSTADESGMPLVLPGFDLDSAMTLMGGDHALFKRVALRFVEQFDGAAGRLAQQIEAGQLTEARAATHQIKGAAGNLGAKTLHQAADVLETALDEAVAGKVGAGETALDALTRFCQALTEVVDSVATLATAHSASAEAAETAEFECDQCNWRHASELFTQVRGLVDQYDFVPHELLVDLRDCVRCRPLRTQVDILMRHVERTEYDKAKHLLDSLSCREGHDLHVRDKG